jgi:hypothetical protein
VTDQGDPVLSEEALERVRDHVATIIGVAWVPGEQRADLADELLGHLVERTAALRADGLNETDAIARAIAGFGTPEDVGSDLARTYHSGLWASTIGVLLPAVALRDGRPGVVGWIRFGMFLAFVIGLAGGIFAVGTSSPVRAVVLFLLAAPGVALMPIAFRAVGRGQRWALWYGLGMAGEFVFIGVVELVTPRGDGSVTYSLTGILGLGILVTAWLGRQRLAGFVAGSRPIGRRMASGVGVALLAGFAAFPISRAVPDPTQATPADLTMTASLTCERTVCSQRLTLTMDTTWQRDELLPWGMGGAWASWVLGDTAGFAFDGQRPRPFDWTLDTTDKWPVRDLATGEPAGWFGSGARSGELIPMAAETFTVEIPSGEIRPHRTIRTTWPFISALGVGDNAPWPRVTVTYAHLDRFTMTASVGCGETVHGMPNEAPTPEAAPQDNPIGL